MISNSYYLRSVPRGASQPASSQPRLRTMASSMTLLYCAVAHTPLPPPPLLYTTHVYTQPCDHNDFRAQAPTFQQRFLLGGVAGWENGTGPVLFYAGNEGAIEGFAAATGWQWELAKQLGALVVFAEHRGYGASAGAWRGGACKGDGMHVSSGEALADFASLASHLRGEWGVGRAPIIAVGGSYGGTLAAWLRQRYSHQFAGALAASAVLTLGDEWSVQAVYDRVSADFTCALRVGAAFRQLWAAAATASGRASAARQLKLCSVPESPQRMEVLIGLLQQGFMTMAELDYPYAVHFAGYSLPGNSSAVACDRFEAAGAALLPALGAALSVVPQLVSAMFSLPRPAPVQLASVMIHPRTPPPNEMWWGALRCSAIAVVSQSGMPTPSTQDPARTDAGCINTSQTTSFEETLPGLVAGAWAYQRCSDIVIPYEARASAPLFLPCEVFAPNCWSIERFSSWCESTYGVRPQPRSADVEHGGRWLGSASRIIFTNGELDPWSTGSISAADLPTDAAQRDLVAITMRGAQAPPTSFPWAVWRSRPGRSVGTEPWYTLCVGAAHHLDLRSTNPADPPDVRKARETQKQYVQRWIAEDQKETEEGE
jgi:pimeloyl-ACP methyl ester carboxylesterase